MERHYIKDADGKSRVKPLTGDLVRLDDVYAQRPAWSTFVPAGTDDVGIVVRTWGVRVSIRWSNGQKSTPKRTCVEVLSEYR
jgi:hypothetical protein